MAAALLVVAKAPVPGRAKTRLCPPATPQQAAGIAAAALLDTVDAVTATAGVVPVIALTGELARAVDGGRIRAALRGWTILEQRGETFGARLAAAHADTAARYPGAPVLQIGMDTPQVTPALLGYAVERLLGGTLALLGRAFDGGWWALGLREPAGAAALRGVPTSRADTGALTEAALRRQGLPVARLPRLSDVDTMEDAWAVAAAAPGTRFAALIRELAPGPAPEPMPVAVGRSA
jgi:glycosyltransferase A (GT-A) superfamily protein (DUF2064 family)